MERGMHISASWGSRIPFNHDSVLDLAIKKPPGDVLMKGMNTGTFIKDTESTSTRRSSKVNKKPLKIVEKSVKPSVFGIILNGLS